MDPLDRGPTSGASVTVSTDEYEPLETDPRMKITIEL